MQRKRRHSAFYWGRTPWGVGRSEVRGVVAAITNCGVAGSSRPGWNRGPDARAIAGHPTAQSDSNAAGNRVTDIMYLTVSGDVRTVDSKTDHESLRKLFLDRDKFDTREEHLGFLRRWFRM